MQNHQLFTYKDHQTQYVAPENSCDEKKIPKKACSDERCTVLVSEIVDQGRQPTRQGHNLYIHLKSTLYVSKTKNNAGTYHGTELPASTNY